MPGFDAIYKQTVTVFNRVVEGESTKWYATVISGVHLVIDQSIIVATYGEQSSDNALLHIRYKDINGEAVVGGKTYMKPKVFRASGDPYWNITFAYGDEFDFIMAGAYPESGPINDDDYRNGFFNYMNKTYDDVFAITKVAKFNLLPHFEIVAR